MSAAASSAAPASPAGQAVVVKKGQAAHAGRIRSKGVPAELRKRSEAYAGNITKRGQVVDKKKKDDGGLRLSPWVVAALVFLLVGSAVVQIIQTASSKPITGAQ